MKNVQAVKAGKAQVEQHHVGRGRLDDLNDLETVARLGNDFVSMRCQDAPQPIPDDLVIFGNDDSYHPTTQASAIL